MQTDEHSSPVSAEKIRTEIHVASSVLSVKLLRKMKLLCKITFILILSILKMSKIYY